ncbi:MAG TPA: hypothetical protein VFN89_03420 [Solirubrobacterales bacterium]|nr:hypothetical protein [Solirubrobacterales bacterium]
MAMLKDSKNLAIAVAVVIAALALLFWTQLLSPKREEATKLASQIETVEASLASHRAEVEEAEAARRRFPAEYERLVVLGKAVPGGDETASLLVQLNGLAHRADVKFSDLELNSEGGGGSGEEASAPLPSPGGQPVSATEVAASLLPLGASIGPAGLAVMPYTLSFEGDFFQVADFIEQLDKMVKTENEKVLVDGRLITVDGFSLSPEGEGEGAASSSSSPSLTANFEVTAYLTPPGQGDTGGATPAGPAEATATPASVTTGGAP